MASVINNGIPLNNGMLYSWADIVATINGVPLTGITGNEYGDSQDVVNKYGAGRPLSAGQRGVSPRRRKSSCIRKKWRLYSLSPRTGASKTLPPLTLPSLICRTAASSRRIKSETCSFQAIAVNGKRAIRGRKWNLTSCRHISNGQDNPVTNHQTVREYGK